MTKAQSRGRELGLARIGRNGEIRTRDPMHPMHVRYQTALHSDLTAIRPGISGPVKLVPPVGVEPTTP